ncbi:MAG: SDR family oxidoreductase [Nitrosarchaeum sp.]
MTILITGITGALGSELKKIYPDSISPTHKDFDICELSSVKDIFNNQKIDVVIHTAALTTVRGCEENKTQAMRINVQGTKNLVEEFKNSNPLGKFVYISTACVFDGHSGMYTENSIPYPENFYSLTKLLGEYIVNQFENSLIIRTNFVGRKTWPYPKAFTDRFGTYLFANQVASGIKDVLDENLQGIIHIVGNKKISMFELAKLTTPDIQAMTMNDYSGPPLTIDMSLYTERWKKYNIKDINK